MTYDLHGSWDDHTGHQSPLYVRSGETGNDTYLNVDWAAQYWVQRGAPKEKLNIGMSLYGRTFKLPWGAADSRVGAAAAGAGQAGQYTREAGFLSYYEVCDLLKTGGQKYYITEQKVPYAVKGDLWVGYDDKDSLCIKVDYIKRNGFGGVMVWALDLDDFSGLCGQGKYPLLKAIKDALYHPTSCSSITNQQVQTQAPLQTQPYYPTVYVQQQTTHYPATHAPQATTHIPPAPKATTQIPPVITSGSST
ncbi:hypothetical protein CHS0354_028961 [Potamilus streckersoni]|uniref:GH18 domain-containing protein n=1 Tax=Potamilus streckersoni TaxID=2493646 RepID=A0AAE0SB88_9BIVA|nr:hypothetical protein CHS0354_028961 [Potamilus streckersoni]